MRRRAEGLQERCAERKRAAGSGKRNNGRGSDAGGQRSHQGWALVIETLS